MKVSKNVLFDEFFDNCQEALFGGDVCFTGKRSEVIELLQELDNWDILGDEYRLKNVWYHGKRNLQYDVYDGPNEYIMYEHVISQCK